MRFTIYDAAELINVIPEILIIALFYHKIFRRKYKSTVPYIVWYSMSFLILSIVTLFVSQPQIQITVTFIILILSAVFFYDGSNIVKIFASIYYIALIFISESLFIGVLMLMDFGNPMRLLESGTGRILGMIGTKIFDFWIIVYSCRIYKSKVKSLPLRYWILILMMPFLSAVIINLVFAANENDKSMMGSYMVCVGGLLYLNLSVFNYFESYDKQIRLAALEKITEKENENYRAIAGSYEEIRGIKHDLKNQVSILNDLIKKEDYAAAKSHMKQLYNFVESAVSICYTGNSAVDSIINLKGDYAKSKNIKFMTKINVGEILFDTVGMCRILGNALDNAIEACDRIESGEKCICLAMNQLENKLVIEINNTSPDVDINNLTTSKANKMIHGIGLKSIKQAVKSMNGHMNCSYENEFFTLKIMLIE